MEFLFWLMLVIIFIEFIGVMSLIIMFIYAIRKAIKENEHKAHDKLP